MTVASVGQMHSVGADSLMTLLASQTMQVLMLQCAQVCRQSEQLNWDELWYFLIGQSQFVPNRSPRQVQPGKSLFRLSTLQCVQLEACVTQVAHLFKYHRVQFEPVLLSEYC